MSQYSPNKLSIQLIEIDRLGKGQFSKAHEDFPSTVNMTTKSPVTDISNTRTVMYKKVKYAIDKGNHKTYRWNTVGNCPGEKNSGEHLEGCKHHIGPHKPQSTVKNLSQVQ